METHSSPRLMRALAAAISADPRPCCVTSDSPADSPYLRHRIVKATAEERGLRLILGGPDSPTDVARLFVWPAAAYWDVSERGQTIVRLFQVHPSKPADQQLELLFRFSFNDANGAVEARLEAELRAILEASTATERRWVVQELLRLSDARVDAGHEQIIISDPESGERLIVGHAPVTNLEPAKPGYRPCRLTMGADSFPHPAHPGGPAISRRVTYIEPMFEQREQLRVSPAKSGIQLIISHVADHPDPDAPCRLTVDDIPLAHLR